MPPLYGFLGGSYSGKSTMYLSDRSVNLYPDLSPAPSPKQVVAMYGTPGTLLVNEVGVGPIRGSHTFNSVLFIVSYDKLYSMTTTGVVSAVLGTLDTNSGPVEMVSNGLTTGGVGGNQLAIVDGEHVYIYNVGTGVFT